MRQLYGPRAPFGAVGLGARAFVGLGGCAVIVGLTSFVGNPHERRRREPQEARSADPYEARGAKPHEYQTR